MASQNIFPAFSAEEEIDTREYYRRFNPESTVCPALEQKMGRKGTIRHPSFGWWVNGEAQNPQVPVGESAMWRRDVDEVKVYTEPMPKLKSRWMRMTKEERQEWISMSENRPHITLRVISEYGSTRDEGGWTRQMVMYEEGTQSPYPFTNDMFTEETERLNQELNQFYTLVEF